MRQTRSQTGCPYVPDEGELARQSGQLDERAGIGPVAAEGRGRVASRLRSARPRERRRYHARNRSPRKSSASAQQRGGAARHHEHGQSLRSRSTTLPDARKAAPRGARRPDGRPTGQNRLTRPRIDRGHEEAHPCDGTSAAGPRLRAERTGVDADRHALERSLQTRWLVAVEHAHRLLERRVQLQGLHGTATHDDVGAHALLGDDGDTQQHIGAGGHREGGAARDHRLAEIAALQHDLAIDRLGAGVVDARGDLETPAKNEEGEGLITLSSWYVGSVPTRSRRRAALRTARTSERRAPSPALDLLGDVVPPRQRLVITRSVLTPSASPSNDGQSMAQEGLGDALDVGERDVGAARRAS